MPLVCNEIRGLAQCELRNERLDGTCQNTFPAHAADVGSVKGESMGFECVGDVSPADSDRRRVLRGNEAKPGES